MIKLSPVEKIALWADQLRDMSALGLNFTSNVYDLANYQRIQDIAMAMLALVHDIDVEELEPLRGTIFSRPSPLVGVDAAIIDDDGRILLIQRADDKLWAMPGGLTDVGETPAETAVREVLEETGLSCTAQGLVGVFDSRFSGTRSSQQLYHFVFHCILSGLAEVSPSTPGETLAKDWYTEETLPELSPGHAVRIKQAFAYWRGAKVAYFDPVA